MKPLSLPLQPESLFERGRRGACLGALALVSLLAFEAMAVAAAMPAVAAALGGLDLYAPAFGGMLAASVLGMVLAGGSCDRHGPLRATAGGLAVFTFGLLLAGLADRMAWLVAGRVVQGLGGGMLGVALYAGTGRLVPPPLHPRLFALFAAAWVLPALLGPLAAAALVDRLGWRAVFLVVAAAAPLSALWLLPAFGRLAPPVRGPGSALTGGPRTAWAALGAAGALLLQTAGQATTAWSMLAAGVPGLAAAALAARRLLPRGSLRAAPGLPAVVALRGLLASAFASAEVFVPLYLTRERGWTLAQAGLVLSLGAVLWSAGSALQARIEGRTERQRALQWGFGCVCGGLALAAAPMFAPLPAAVLAAGWAVAGFGVGLAFPMLSVLTLALSAPDEQGANASALQLSDALCCSGALAAAGALFAAAGDQGAQGHALVLGLAMALALTGALLGRRAFA